MTNRSNIKSGYFYLRIYNVESNKNQEEFECTVLARWVGGRFVKGLYHQVHSVKLTRDRLNLSLPVLPLLPVQGQQVFYHNMTTIPLLWQHNSSEFSTNYLKTWELELISCLIIYWATQTIILFVVTSSLAWRARFIPLKI